MDVGSTNFRFDLDTKNGLQSETQAYRAPKTTELHLDSLDRYLPSMLTTNSIFTNFPNQNVAKLAGPLLLNSSLSGTNMTIQSARPLVYGYFGRVALTQFFLKFMQPSITAGYNDQFVIVTASSPTGPVTSTITITLDPGYYTIAQLAIQLQNKLVAAGLAQAGVLAPDTIGNENVDGFLVTSGTPTVLLAVVLTSATTESQMLRQLRTLRTLGFTRTLMGYPDVNNGAQTSTAPTYWQTALGSAPNLLATDYVDIVSTALTNYKDAKDANSSVSSPGAVIGRVWLTEGAVNQSSAPADPTEIGSFPITVTKTWSNPNWCQWSPNQTINAVDIRLIDMYGDTIPWSNANPTEWSATLTLTE